MRHPIRRVLLAIGFAASAASPAGAQLAPGLHAYTIEFGGHTRSYDVYVPVRYHGTPAPLVLDFHAFTSDKDAQRSLSGFDRKADQIGFLVAYPQGYGLLASWNTPTCCGDAMYEQLDDVGLAVAIVDAIAAATPIDRRRVYATGLSNGGALAHLLACRAADTFAAVAPVSFPLPVTPASACQPARGVSVITFQGFNDTAVPFASTNYLAPYTARGSFAAWAAIDQCPNPPQLALQIGGSYCAAFVGCRDGAADAMCGLRGDHVLYTNIDNVRIADLAWSAFAKFSLPP